MKQYGVTFLNDTHNESSKVLKFMNHKSAVEYVTVSFEMLCLQVQIREVGDQTLFEGDKGVIAMIELL